MRQDGRTIVEAILKVQSVDLVADPATTHGLYEGLAPGEGASTPITLSTATLEVLRAARPDLVDAVRAETAAELVSLREHVVRLQGEIEVRRRRETAQSLLREYRLPDPSLAEAAARPLVSEQFLETVLAAADESAMRRLVEERAQLIAAARLCEGESYRGGTRPVSREQQWSEPRTPALDARSFARAIS